MQFAKQIKGNLLSPVIDVMFRENEKSCILIPVGVVGNCLYLGTGYPMWSYEQKA